MSKAIQKSKICAGNGCSKDGIYPLTIIYLNKLGWFCKSCKNDLILEGLVIESKGTGPDQDPAPTVQAQSSQDVNLNNDYSKTIR